MARPWGKIKERRARRRRAPLFGAAGAEKLGKKGGAAGAPPDFWAKSLINLTILRKTSKNPSKKLKMGILKKLEI